MRVVESYTNQLMVMKSSNPWHHPLAVPVVRHASWPVNADQLLDLTPPEGNHIGMAVYQGTFYFYSLPTAPGPTASDEDRWMTLTGEAMYSNGIQPIFHAAR